MTQNLYGYEFLRRDGTKMMFKADGASAPKEAAPVAGLALNEAEKVNECQLVFGVVDRSSVPKCLTRKCLH